MTVANEIRAGGTQNSGFVFTVSAVSALAGLLFGYDTGVISGAILFVQEDFRLSTFQEEIVVGAVLLGAMIGAAFGGRLADHFGRRLVLIQVACLFILGALGTALAPGSRSLALGRVVVGIAIGIASFTAPLYISEISPAHIRGKLVSLNQLMITIGILVSYLADYALAGSRGWRWMFGLAAIPGLILLIGLFFVPESPRWFVKQQLRDRARAVLAKIRNPLAIDAELGEIESSFAQQEGSWRELLSPALRPALLIGVWLAIFQQFTGINTVIYYAPTIFQLAGLQSHSAAILATAGVGAVNVLLTVLALELLDRTGRRPLLLFGLVGMILSLVLLGAAFLAKNPTPALAWTSLICVMAYVACFAISLGPIFWLMIAEIYPLKLRSRAMAVATMFNWGSNLLVALTFLSLLRALGRPATFWLYALVGVVAWVFVLRLVPETKGKTLEQIEAAWRSHHAH
ncbi:MAG TPA: sugar porter family MFS transporter [Candidatus Acidoferrales bacterium]|nr:sugar porter family MFS transporter [Candidatus Acidoferrales bacterium]